MSYIIFVNPIILVDAGMDHDALITATIPAFLTMVTMVLTYSISTGI
jgi:xanthine/uracil/vitamin C permease (AzgA family)